MDKAIRIFILGIMVLGAVVLAKSMIGPSDDYVDKAMAVAKKNSITTEWRIKSGAMICITWSGLEQAQYTMNKAQLESLGCIKTARDAGVERNTNRFGYRPSEGVRERVSVMFPDKVISVWVSGYYLKRH